MRAIKNGINTSVAAWCKWTFCRLPSSSNELSITSRGVLRVLEPRGETRCFYDFSPTLTRLVLPVKNLLSVDPDEWANEEIFIAPLPFSLLIPLFMSRRRLEFQQQQQHAVEATHTMRAHTTELSTPMRSIIRGCRHFDNGVEFFFIFGGVSG